MRDALLRGKSHYRDFVASEEGIAVLITKLDKDRTSVAQAISDLGSVEAFLASRVVMARDRGEAGQ